MFLLQANLCVCPAETSGMQLVPPVCEHSFDAAGPDGQLAPLDLSFSELPERVRARPRRKALSVATLLPVYIPEGKHTIFANRCLCYTFKQ